MENLEQPSKQIFLTRRQTNPIHRPITKAKSSPADRYTHYNGETNTDPLFELFNKMRSRSGFVTSKKSPAVLLSEKLFYGSKSPKSGQSSIRVSQLSIKSYLNISVSSMEPSFLDISDDLKRESLLIVNKTPILQRSHSIEEVDEEGDDDSGVKNCDIEHLVVENNNNLENLQIGEVEITINHVHKTNLLNVTLHRANIQPYIQDSVKQVFAKICLLPHKTQNQTSRRVMKCSMMVWDETFVFKKLTMGQLESFGIRIKFYSKSEVLKKRVAIGEATVQLNDVDQKNFEKNIIGFTPKMVKIKNSDAKV